MIVCICLSSNEKAEELTSAISNDQGALKAHLRNSLAKSLPENVEWVDCNREAYGHNNQSFRYDCNYSTKEHLNIGTAIIDASEIAPSTWAVGSEHQLDMLQFCRRGSEGLNYLEFQYNIFSGTNLSRADADVQRNLTHAVILNSEHIKGDHSVPRG
jgi:hypothetical protein